MRINGIFVFNLTEDKNNFNINDTVNLTGRNWHNAIGYADIRDMHINRNGDIDLLVTNVYDFNPNSKSDLIQVGRERQEKGEITPLFCNVSCYNSSK